jgi:peptidoglycan/LPS O-acetylase OafA/YrhL
MSDAPFNISQNLDRLRALAVGAVFLAHLGVPLPELGRFGVVLFFVHTSLVLMQSLSRMKAPATGARELVLAFWLRRVFRLYPLAIVCTLTVAVLHIGTVVGTPVIHPGWREVVANLLLVQNLVGVPSIPAVLWSLPLEAQMYLLLPLLFLVLPPTRRPWKSLAMWTGSVALAFLFPHPSGPLMLLSFAPCFLAGVVGFDVLRSGVFRRVLPSWSWPAGLVAALALVAPLNTVDRASEIYVGWVLALAVVLLFLYTREPERPDRRTLSHWVAEHSYGIYLTHTLIFSLTAHRMDWAPLPVRVLALVAGSVIAPALLYRWIEQPMIRVGAGLSRRILVASQSEGASREAESGAIALS